ncbi:MAG: transglycosylase SLT domain-containing protein, partial [Pyrinomonadaceae bacterium]
LMAAVVVAFSLVLAAEGLIGVLDGINRTEKTEGRSKSKVRQQPTLILDEEPENTSAAPIETAVSPMPSVRAPDDSFDGQTLTAAAAATPQVSATTVTTATTTAATTSFSFTPSPPPPPSNVALPVQRPVTVKKLYLQMSPPEQMAFVEQHAERVSAMMGNRPYAFTPEALDWIKRYVDAYARRVGNNSTRLWAEDVRFMFARARTQYTPYIIRAFNARGVPSVVGVYLCVIETEYHNIESENFAGAAGLFQFIGPTAEAYGVPRAERTNVEKMAPAAAAYMAHRIAEFGTDSMSVALGIAGYNRNPDSVRRDLRDVLNSENKERSFWTLIVNSTKLDHYFQGENIKYVPKFFAAAIVGEHPSAFGLDGMRPLSTYDELPSKQPPPPPTAAVPQSSRSSPGTP